MSNSKTFNLNKILNETNNSLISVLEPLSVDIETNCNIVNKLNLFIEDIPKYKELNNHYKNIECKYNKLLIKYNENRQTLCEYEKKIKLLLNKNNELNQLNKYLINKLISRNNLGYWYENIINDEIEMKIIEKNIEMIKKMNVSYIY